MSYVRSGATLIAAVAAIAAFPARAHHSAREFDDSKKTVYVGVVKKFEIINPHGHVIIVYKDPKHGPTEATFETGGTSHLIREGYKRGSVKVGDTITVYANPRHDGHPGGFLYSYRDAQGKVVGY